MSHIIWSQLAQDIANWHSIPHFPSDRTQPLIVGILAEQGTGKSTLVRLLKQILKDEFGLNAVYLSLDDLYLPYADRLQLQAQDPRMVWRGPPGTHEIDLGLKLLKQIRAQQFPAFIPQFDKSLQNGAGDRTTPLEIQAADIVLFEGWFVGCRPVSPFQIGHAPPSVVAEADRDFAKDMNCALHEYQVLWEEIDRLIVLNPMDYRLSIQWRQEAEAKLRSPQNPGMSDAEIVEFVEYFWKSLHPELFILPLLEEPQWVDRVIDIAADHSPVQIYTPK
ncbi:MAG: glycerate kinase [Alkalinema sp. CAN_BIN05]|nr:glycerate kinase [Alkalinema sp. CAN_BIN05]